MEKGNRDVFYQLAWYYDRGVMGMPQNQAKANELFLKAGELGHAAAYRNLGIHYYNGRGVEVDKKKAMYYNELAAMNGDVNARHKLGCMEMIAGNHQRAYKHFILAVSAGNEKSLDLVKDGYMDGHVTKPGL